MNRPALAPDGRRLILVHDQAYWEQRAQAKRDAMFAAASRPNAPIINSNER